LLESNQSLRPNPHDLRRIGRWTVVSASYQEKAHSDRGRTTGPPSPALHEPPSGIWRRSENAA
jgi:hypothetical protein